MAADSFIPRFCAAGLAAGIAETLTLPADVAKVRLQVQKGAVAGGPLKYQNTFHAATTIVRDEGFTSLWKGYGPAMVRQVSYTGLTLALYPIVRNRIERDLNSMYHGENNGELRVSNTGIMSLMTKLLSGGISGGIAIFVMNPTDVVKVKMQAAADARLSMGGCLSEVLRTDGARGLWAGSVPNIARCFFCNACEIGVYDYAKTVLIANETSRRILGGDGVLTHLASSVTAGLVSSVMTTPLDVIKTRLQEEAGRGVAGERYTQGVCQALVEIPRREGFTALYKGFFPMAVRKVTWGTTFFLTYEQIKKAMSIE